MHRVPILAGWMPAVVLILTICAGLFGPPVIEATERSESMYAVREDTALTPTHEEAPRQGLCMKLEKGGAVIIELYPEKAPLAVARITELAEQGFYDGLEFHRVESYLVQTGRKEPIIQPADTSSSRWLMIKPPKPLNPRPAATATSLIWSAL